MNTGMNTEIKEPFWHPARMDGFILDWDGVLANTRLDFQPVRDKYFGGQIVPLIERAAELPPPLNEEAAAAHPKADHWLRHYVGTLTDIRPPDSVKYYHA